jgi:hypothetical protein
MFNKYYLPLLVTCLYSATLIANETLPSDEIQDVSPYIQCDQQFEKCVEQCESSSTDGCLDRCTDIVDQCYEKSMSQIEDTPPMDHTEDQPSDEVTN